MRTEQDIYGIRAILEAITHKKTIDKIWLLKGQQGSLFKSLEKKIYELGISHSYVPKERLDRFSKKIIRELLPELPQFNLNRWKI